VVVRYMVSPNVFDGTKIFSCHKSEAFKPVRTKPLVRAEIAGFIGVSLGGTWEIPIRRSALPVRWRCPKWRTARRIKGICASGALAGGDDQQQMRCASWKNSLVIIEAADFR